MHPPPFGSTSINFAACSSWCSISACRVARWRSAWPQWNACHSRRAICRRFSSQALTLSRHNSLSSSASFWRERLSMRRVKSASAASPGAVGLPRFRLRAAPIGLSSINTTSYSCVLTALAAKDAESSRWVHDGHTMEPPDALRALRRSFYECFHRRADALFELADAILSADGAAPSPAHLSLQPSHRRGWGSLYAALDRG